MLSDRPIVKNMKQRFGIASNQDPVGRDTVLGGVRMRTFVTYPATPTKVFFPAGTFFPRRAGLAGATPTSAIETVKRGRIIV